LNVASKSGLLNLSAFVGTIVTSPAAGATCGTIAFVAAVFVYTTGTLASFAFLMSAWSAGMLSLQAGRVEQVGLITSRTTSAVVFASSVTATGAGSAGARFGLGAGDADAVGTAVGAAVVGAAVACGGVGDGAAAGEVQADATASSARSPRARRMSPPI